MKNKNNKNNKILLPKYILHGNIYVPESLKIIDDYFSSSCNNKNYILCLVGERESVNRDLKKNNYKGKEFIHLTNENLNSIYSYLPKKIIFLTKNINKMISNVKNTFNTKKLGIHSVGLVPIFEINKLKRLGYGNTSWYGLDVYSQETQILDVITLYSVKVAESGFNSNISNIKNEWKSQILYLNTNIQAINNLSIYTSALPMFKWKNETFGNIYSVMPPQSVRIGLTENLFFPSLICPLRTVTLDGFGDINIEISVRGTKGYFGDIVNGKINNQEDISEIEGTTVGEIRVIVSIWLVDTNGILDLFKRYLPIGKKNAILINTVNPVAGKEVLDLEYYSNYQNKFNIPSFSSNSGKGTIENFMNTIGDGINLSTKDLKNNFDISSFNKILYTEAKVGNIIPNKNAKISQLILDAINLVCFDYLKPGNIFSWAIFPGNFKKVNPKEYLNHVEFYGKNDITVPNTSSYPFCDENGVITKEEKFSNIGKKLLKDIETAALKII